MKAKGDRVSLADLLGIQVLRRLNKNEPTYCADIDAPLSADAPRDHRGRLKNPVRVLADRADRILQTRHGVSAGWLGEVVGWLRVLRFLGYIAILLIAFGIAEPLLKEGQVVNVEWLFGFLATLVVSMLITTVLMILAVFARRRNEDSPDETSSGGVTTTFAKLLVVHWLIQFVIRRAVPWIERRILKRTGEKSPEEIKRIEKVTENLYDTLSQQSRRTALEAAATSNTVWCLLSIGVLLSLGKMGLFRAYDFRWQATIVSEDFMRQTTQTMAMPIQGLPLVEMPGEADVHWLATGESPHPNPQGERGQSVDDSETAQESAEAAHQYHRQLWGRLFLAYLLYYGVLPRFVLMVISRWLAARGWRGLRPRLKDPYFKTIVENIENPPFDSHQEEQEEPEEEFIASVGRKPHEQTPNKQTQQARVAVAEKPHETTASDLGADTVVFSFDIPEPDEGWPKALAMANGGVISLGNAGDRAGRKRAGEEIHEKRDDIGLLVIVADLVDNPDGLFEHFVKETVTSLHPEAGRALVLTGGERLRQRFEGDSQKIANRIELWKYKAAESGIEPDKIVEFDLEHATTKGRDLLKERMRAFQPKSAKPEGKSAKLQYAGLFRKATSVVIMGRINESTARQSPEELQQTTLEIHRGLRSLYQKQASALEKAFANVTIDTNRIRAAVSDKTYGQFDKLEEFTRMTAVVQRYTKGLSGKWAVGGGLVCALGSGALAAIAAPALLPALIPAAAIGAQAGVFGGVFSAHAPHLFAKLKAGRSGAQEVAEELDEPLPDDPFCLDDLVRSSTLLALILELQGNPEDKIAKSLEAILPELPEHELTTPEAASGWLAEAANRTEKYFTQTERP